jgi:hypothetical protein
MLVYAHAENLALGVVCQWEFVAAKGGPKSGCRAQAGG